MPSSTPSPRLRLKGILFTDRIKITTQVPGDMNKFTAALTYFADGYLVKKLIDKTKPLDQAREFKLIS